MAKKKKTTEKPTKKPWQRLRTEAKAATKAVDKALHEVFVLARNKTYAGVVNWVKEDNARFTTVIDNRGATLTLECHDDKAPYVTTFSVADDGREPLPQLEQCSSDSELSQFFHELQALAEITKLDDISAEPRLSHVKELLQGLGTSQEKTE